TTTAEAKAQVRISQPPLIAFTGTDTGRHARMAGGLLILGLMLVAATLRSRGLALAGMPSASAGYRARPGGEPPPSSLSTGLGLGGGHERSARSRRTGPPPPL
ncbi:MAG: hypothetical protein LC733_12640, partial [Actinobacteria bacterium]|nr:hypothetical protein [Actinomycetota bacterium]